MTRRLSTTALLFSLLFAPACGSSSAEPPAAAAQAERAGPEQDQPVPTRTTETAGPTGTSGHPTMNDCIARCETEHGPIIDHGRLAECVRQQLDTDTCAYRAINEETNRCQRVCRGLPPELPPELREGAARDARGHGRSQPARSAETPRRTSGPTTPAATE